MPRLIADRLRDDTIEQFRAAAAVRYADAWRLATEGRRTAAVYLWGYVAEMVLKAAYFELIGFTYRRTITMPNLRSAVAQAIAYGIVPSGHGALHNISMWGHLLDRHRVAIHRPYPHRRFGAVMTRHADRVSNRWRPDLRYKQNRAYLFEVRGVAESVDWLFARRNQL